ncbi:MAG: GtrA family protein [Leptolinea sp.]|jgi:putative flippase GtrA|nr:GtrA family protein [Leptolinea sp.]
MILSNPQERTRFFKFAAVGAFGAVIDFGFFNLFISLFGIPAILSSSLSFILAVASNFIFNRYWTYPDSRSKSLARQAVQFLLISLVGMGIRLILFALLENPLITLAGNLLPDIGVTPTFIGHNVTLAFAILVVMMWNFIANRYWTYNDVL